MTPGIIGSAHQPGGGAFTCGQSPYGQKTQSALPHSLPYCASKPGLLDCALPEYGRGDRTRTCGPRLRRSMLYPPELRPQLTDETHSQFIASSVR